MVNVVLVIGIFIRSESFFCFSVVYLVFLGFYLVTFEILSTLLDSCIGVNSCVGVFQLRERVNMLTTLKV